MRVLLRKCAGSIDQAVAQKVDIGAVGGLFVCDNVVDIPDIKGFEEELLIEFGAVAKKDMLLGFIVEGAFDGYILIA